MRASLFFLISIVLLPGPLNAQSALTFARVMDLADLPVTGFAVVNPGTTSARVLFSLRGADGNLVRSTTVDVPAGGQSARLGSELFPRSTAGGWVQATSAASNLRGFWLGGDFATFTDGAEAMPSAAEIVLPVISDSSEVHLVNPTNSNQAVLIRLIGAEGQDITDPEIRLLSASGSFRAKSNVLFAPSDLAHATHARVTCSSCAGAVMLSDYLAAPSLAVANGADMASTAKEIHFPHVIEGTLSGLIYSTVLSVTNLTASEQTLTITFTPETGTSPVTVLRNLPANGTVRETAAALFSFSSGFQNGWIRVTAEHPVAGVVIYAEQVNRGVAVTPGISKLSTELLLGHIAELNPWWTGIALLNPGKATALIDIYAISPAGSRIGHAQIVIAGGAKIARLLNEWTPETALRSAGNDGGFVYLRSSEPIFALELFFRRDLRVLSNVPAFGLGAGERFTPPPF